MQLTTAHYHWSSKLMQIHRDYHGQSTNVQNENSCKADLSASQKLPMKNNMKKHVIGMETNELKKTNQITEKSNLIKLSP